MTDFLNKSFSVYPGGSGGQEYRDNWDRIFGKKERATEMPGPASPDWREVAMAYRAATAHEDNEEFAAALEHAQGMYNRAVNTERAAPGSGKEKAQPVEAEPKPAVDTAVLLECGCFTHAYGCLSRDFRGGPPER